MSALRALTGDGGPLELASSQLDGLRAALRGPLLTQQDAAFAETAAVWNAMIERRPALVARCLGVADVLACVRFARDTGLALSIRGGGHNIAGLAIADRGLMIDLSLQRGVFVDAKRRRAHAQAGCLLGDVDRETQLHGLASVLGFVSQTGIAGLTLGGGFGYLTRRWGWTSDTVRSMRVVTADGRLVTAADDENADLFWGLRGGGGNFGVVTDIEYELHEVGPEITGGAIAWSADEAEGVGELYHELMNAAPPELVIALAARLAPPAPWIDSRHHGRPVIVMFVCHTGAQEDGERLVGRLRSHGRPVGNALQRRSYVSQQAIVDAANPRGRRYYWKSEFVAQIDRELVRALLEHSARIRSPFSAAILFPLGDAVARFADDHSAVGNRDARAAFNIAASWENAAEDELHVAWAREAWRELRRFSTGGTYVNFLTEEEGADRVRAAYRGNLERLARVKKTWDPDNVFRSNKNITPAA